ncbi:MAG: hypothetical protein WBD47_12850 [Phormidesmis sp.]
MTTIARLAAKAEAATAATAGLVAAMIEVAIRAIALRTVAQVAEIHLEDMTVAAIKRASSIFTGNLDIRTKQSRAIPALLRSRAGMAL